MRGSSADQELTHNFGFDCNRQVNGQPNKVDKAVQTNSLEFCTSDELRDKSVITETSNGETLVHGSEIITSPLQLREELSCSIHEDHIEQDPHFSSIVRRQVLQNDGVCVNWHVQGLVRPESNRPSLQEPIILDTEKPLQILGQPISDSNSEDVNSKPEVIFESKDTKRRNILVHNVVKWADWETAYQRSSSTERQFNVPVSCGISRVVCKPVKWDTNEGIIRNMSRKGWRKKSKVSMLYLLNANLNEQRVPKPQYRCV